MKSGSLCAVGIGIRAPEQTTAEAVARIERAEKVFSLVADPFSQYWLESVNRSTESLAGLYAREKERRQTYLEMVERIVDAVRTPSHVCAVSYGHPGVAAFPLHESVRRARDAGFPAEMLAAVSAEDCLFADLGIDPMVGGCRSYEATDFLINHRGADPASNLVLWQIGAIGERSWKPDAAAWNRDGLAVLIETLLAVYPPEHEVVVYEAARLPVTPPRVTRVALRDVAHAPVTPLSTLFVPPACASEPDESIARRIGFLR